ncbi:MAG: DoxX family protein [Candidatus Pacebacteria bacterium]|nr:DoxX family protein [Candidatus Paceibacterota bacterium]
MQSVSLFPQLLSYGFFATFILRASLGLFFIRFAYLKFSGNRENEIAFFDKLGLRPGNFFFWVVAIAKLIIGIGLLLGFYTQGVALLGFVLMVVAVFIKRRRPELLPENTASFFVLLAIVLGVLIFLGPGSFAFDLPV